MGARALVFDLDGLILDTESTDFAVDFSHADLVLESMAELVLDALL